MTEELDGVRAERHSLLSERTANTQTSSQEKETLLSRVASLMEERDQLQETLQGLRQETEQLRAELEDKMEALQGEVSHLASVAQLRVVLYIYSRCDRTSSLKADRNQLSNPYRHNNGGNLCTLMTL